MGVNPVEVRVLFAAQEGNIQQVLTLISLFWLDEQQPFPVSLEEWESGLFQRS